MRLSVSCVTSAALVLAVSANMNCVNAAEGGNRYTVRAQVALWNAESGGDFDYSSGTTPSVGVDDLDLDSASATFRYELSAQLPLFYDVYLGGFAYGEDSSVALGAAAGDDFTFGNQDFTNENIAAEFKVKDTYIEIAYSPVNLFTGIKIGLAVHKQKITTTITAPGISETIDESVTFPALSLRGWVSLPKGVMLEGRVHYFSLGLSDYDVEYTEVNVQVSYSPINNVGVFLGYQMSQMTLDFDSVGGINAVSADYDLQGPYLGITAQF